MDIDGDGNVLWKGYYHMTVPVIERILHLADAATTTRSGLPLWDVTR
jgi:hypothetical protein